MIITPHIDGMERKVLSANDVAKIRATFYLGEMCAIGNECDPDYDLAQECFEEVIKADIDKELSAASSFWLALMAVKKGEKDKGKKYLVEGINIVCGFS